MSEWPEFSSEASAIWEGNAVFWDETMGADGNDFHRLLVRPATEQLLEVQPGQVILDIGCGNGNFSRRLVALGARVVAIDASQTMLERAKAHSDEPDRINYQRLDVTDGTQLAALGQGRFDAAVANMVLMDIPTIEPLLKAISRLLKPGGRLVFSVLHPCFMPNGMTRFVEEEDRDGQIIKRHGVKISHYLTPNTAKGLAVKGQPQAQYYFHRPLNALFGPCFAAGFAIDGLAEPAFNGEISSERDLSWANFKEIPPFLVVRLRLSR